jgi:hypothetical protein
MMKYLYRTLIILLVIGLVGGGLYLILNNNSSMTTNLAGEGGGQQRLSESENFSPPSGEAGQLAGQPPSGNGFRAHGGEGESSNGLSALGEVLIKIAGITAAVALIQWLIHLFKRRKVITANSGS